MFLIGLIVLNPLGILGLMDANWMCSMVYVEYQGVTYSCPVFDWITKTKSSFAVGKGMFLNNQIRHLELYLSCDDI